MALVCVDSNQVFRNCFLDVKKPFHSMQKTFAVSKKREMLSKKKGNVVETSKHVRDKILKRKGDVMEIDF